MRKSNLLYQQCTIKVLKCIADKVLGRTFEFDDFTELNVPDEEENQQHKESEERPYESEKILDNQHKEDEDEENIETDENKDENSEEEKDEENDENKDEDMEEEEEKDKDKELDDDAEEDLNQSEEEKGEDGSDHNGNEDIAHTSEEEDRASAGKAPLAAVDETNVSKASDETNSTGGDMILATTKEVIAGLEPLATAPASPKGKGIAKAASHSASSPTKNASPANKPKKKVTKKANLSLMKHQLMLLKVMLF
ncbi:hypothetical protein CCACVL1_04110 [Corchorus capsularis]|uniref:Uncharacterized protein n=1 Tax=Corchorus capsularis TaxID=210143 RepID=A0A1R3JV45_COCAP|nr:hypothetical protein CCACVL1_04110 [Corchorus capsularis]